MVLLALFKKVVFKKSYNSLVETKSFQNSYKTLSGVLKAPTKSYIQIALLYVFSLIQIFQKVFMVLIKCSLLQILITDTFWSTNNQNSSSISVTPEKIG